MTGCWANTTPLCAAAEGCVTMARRPALPARPVAVKLTVLVPPLSAAEASRVLAPAVPPRVQVTAAKPLASVWATAAAVPPPPVTVNVTLTPVTGLPLRSVTCTCGSMATGDPAVAVWLFPAVMARLAGAPAPSAMALLVAPLSPLAAKPRVRLPAVPLSARSVKVAMPCASVATGEVPPRLPPPLAMLAVTVTPACATGLPPPSWSCTTGWVVSATPLCAVVAGWVCSTSWAAGPAARVSGLAVTPARPVAPKARV